MKTPQYFLILPLLLLIANNSFGQVEYPLSNESRILNIMQFVQNNIDSIKKYNSSDTLTISVTFKEHPDNNSVNEKNAEEFEKNILEEIKFYNSFNMTEINETKTWKPFYSYIKSMYEFIPSFDYNHCFTKQDFSIPLNKDTLNKSIRDITFYIEKTKKNTKSIPLNSNFNFKINKLFIRNSSSTFDSIICVQGQIPIEPIDIKNFILISKLDNLNSNLIKLDKKTFLIFRVVSSSNFGEQVNELEIKVYYKEKEIYKDKGLIINGLFTTNTSSSTNNNEHIFNLDMTIEF